MTPAKLVASLPESIRVGAHDIRLRIMDKEHRDDQEVHGQFCASRLLIELEPEAPSRTHIADTLLHEINHAIYHFGNIKEADGEERTVTALTTGQIQVLRDNPWLLKWLAKALA